MDNFEPKPIRVIYIDKYSAFPAYNDLSILQSLNQSCKYYFDFPVRLDNYYKLEGKLLEIAKIIQRNLP